MVLPYLLAFVNSKSGGQKGATVHAALSSLLTEQKFPRSKSKVPSKFRGRVCDLAKSHDPAGMVRAKLRDFPDMRLLVCGGDGTICWVLDAVSSLQIPKREDTPAIAVMPLGTGNDLSRTYGWGASFSRRHITRKHLYKVLRANVVDLDLWEMTLTMPRRGLTEDVRKWIPPGLHAVSKGAGCGGVGGGGAVEGGSVEGGAESKTSVAGQSEGRAEVEACDSHTGSTRGGTESQAIEMSVVGAADDGAAAADTNGSAAGDDAASGSETFVGTFCNYFSIGMTARGAMAFHEERENRPGRFTSPLKNKVIYAQKGCGMVCGDCMCHPTVAGRVSVQVMPSSGATFEDVDVANHLCEINVLNIQSYSGGVIKTPTFSKASRASSTDGLLEVAGLGNYVSTSCCVGFGRMCCMSPMRRIAQGAGLRISVNGEGNGEPLVAQFDGEPFMLPPGTRIQVRLKEFPGRMLTNRERR